jgi:hypothetical protein
MSNLREHYGGICAGAVQGNNGHVVGMPRYARHVLSVKLYKHQLTWRTLKIVKQADCSCRTREGDYCASVVSGLETFTA